MEGHGCDPNQPCWLCNRGRAELNAAAFAQMQQPPVPPPAACKFLGDELTGTERAALGMDHAKRWARCLHPGTPLGEIACGCGGCGVNCRGYLKGE